MFEEEMQSYLGVRNVISCGNGTDALQIAMMALGLKPGDEVIIPAYTFCATAIPFGKAGAKNAAYLAALETFDAPRHTRIGRLRIVWAPNLSFWTESNDDSLGVVMPMRV